MGLIADLTNAEYKVDALEADFVRDWVRFKWIDGPDDAEHYIQFTWTEAHSPQDAIDAIDAAILAGEGIIDTIPEPDPEANGTGLIVDLGSVTHPRAEVQGADLSNSMLPFRWIGGPYNGDCAIPFTFTLETTAQDIVAAILETVP